MSYIRPGDKDLHYSDWGHRHLGGNGSDESNEWWADRMATHMAKHQQWHEAGLDPDPPSQGCHRYEDYPD